LETDISSPQRVAEGVNQSEKVPNGAEVGVGQRPASPKIPLTGEIQ